MSDKQAPVTPQQQKPEARLTPVDFEAIGSLMEPRRDCLTDKVMETLTEAETIELRRINDVLDGLETEYRRPVMAKLKRIEASIAKQQAAEAESVADSENSSQGKVMAKETIQEDEITCPYCVNVYSDSWEYRLDDDVLECESCGKRFGYQRIVQVSYDTQAIEEANKSDESCPDRETAKS